MLVAVLLASSSICFQPNADVCSKDFLVRSTKEPETCRCKKIRRTACTECRLILMARFVRRRNLLRRYVSVFFFVWNKRRIKRREINGRKLEGNPFQGKLPERLIWKQKWRGAGPPFSRVSSSIRLVNRWNAIGWSYRGFVLTAYNNRPNRR